MNGRQLTEVANKEEQGRQWQLCKCQLHPLPQIFCDLANLIKDDEVQFAESTCQEARRKGVQSSRPEF